MYRQALLLLLVFSIGGPTVAVPTQCPTVDSINTRIGLITVSDYSEQDRLKGLVAYYRQIKDCPALVDSTHSFLLRKIGVLYAQLKNYQQAIAFTKQAIAVIRSNSHKPSVQIFDLPKCYYNLQAYYDSTHQEDLKWEAVDSCIATDLRIGGNYFYSSYMMKDKLRNLLYNGDYVSCIKFATLAEKILNPNDALQLDARCYAILQHVNALIFLKRYQEAESLLAAEWNSFYLAKQHVGSLYIQAGITKTYMGSYANAAQLFSKAADSSMRKGYKIGSAESFHWTGFLHAEKMGQPLIGLQYYKRALQYADAIDSVSILSYIGKTYASINQFDSAFRYFRYAFNVIKPDSDERTVLREVLNENSGEEIINSIAELLMYKGDAFLALYKFNQKIEALQSAIAVYTIGDQLVSNLQTIHLEIQSQLFWRDNTRRLYENAIEACYHAHEAEKAFYFFEKGRAAILNAQLNEQRWIPESGMSRLSRLRQEVYRMERTMNEMEKTSATFVEMQKTVYEKKQQLEALQKQVAANSPMHRGNMVDTVSVRISEVQQKILNTHNALIELFAGDSAVYVFTMAGNKVTLEKMDKRSFDSLSRRFTLYLSNREMLNSHYADFLHTSAELYKTIFANQNLPSGRMIISPDGKYFPFEALVTNLKPLEYFVEKNAVSYAYSVKYLLNNTSTSAQSNKLFLGIAPIEFQNEWQLPNLGGSELSLSKIENHFSTSTSLIGNNATRNNFLKDFYTHRIIQLYTHATDSGSNGEPTIYFYDSTLTLSELIYSRKPGAQLIVLSACETGSGKLYNGEGVFNFNRGFAAIGIPSSISNLWEVDAESTYALTELFYKHLAEGSPSDVALQLAKKEFFHQSTRNQLPYLWAAPILVGDSNIVVGKQSSAWKRSIVIAIVLMTMWLIIKFMIVKKRSI